MSSKLLCGRAAMIKVGSALLRYYNRIPGSESSSSSSRLTPTVVISGSTFLNTSQSVSKTYESADLGCSSQGKRFSVCETLRKRKASHAPCQRPRSNPAVTLLNVDADTVPLCTVPVSPGLGIEVIALSSDGSNETAHSTNSVETVEAAKVRKGKGKLPIIEEVDDMSDDEFEPDVKEKVPKKNYDATRKFQDTWSAKLPWAELFRGSDGLYESVKCVVCS